MHARIKLSLSQTLEYVISQRLVTRKSGEGRVASLEILKTSGLIKEQILKAENFDSINDAIKMGKTEYGMQTFDQSLIYLAENNIITKSEAIKNASNRQDMEMHFQGLA
jgi:twitching motility protein PilT